MAIDQKRVMNEIWSRRAPDLPVKTPQDLIILASIVEKETGRADERTRVAGVFINRLGKRMKLQSDPTIVYGLVGGKGTLGRGILRTEIERPTPYNTYVIDGLPPGPITNPGRAALEAVANPSRTKDVYFVADGSGGHVFAETLEQHQRNVTRWRQVEAARSGAGKPEATIDRVEPSIATNDNRGQTAPAGDPRASAFAPLNPAGTPSDAYPPQIGRGPQAPPGGRVRAFDASEGTAKDPLRNKTYDLNSPKTVPPVRP
jgi:UPF0755 protein